MMAKAKHIKIVPQGKYIGAIWTPTNPDPKGLSKLEKYQAACKKNAEINKKKAAYVLAREKYRRISQEIGQLMKELQEYLI